MEPVLAKCTCLPRHKFLQSDDKAVVKASSEQARLGAPGPEPRHQGHLAVLGVSQALQPIHHRAINQNQGKGSSCAKVSKWTLNSNTSTKTGQPSHQFSVGVASKGHQLAAVKRHQRVVRPTGHADWTAHATWQRHLMRDGQGTARSHTALPCRTINQSVNIIN